MNILILTPRMPYPPFRGDKLKIFNLAINLSKSNKVSILTFVQNTSELSGIDAYSKMGIDVITIRQPLFKSLCNIILFAWTGKPFQQLYYQNKKYADKITQLLGTKNIDVIYYHLIRMTPYFSETQYPDKLHVSDYTDAISLYLSRMCDIEKNPFKKMFFKIEQKRVKEAEKINLKFDLSYVCSESDKKYLSDFSGHQHIKIMPNGINVDTFSADLSVKKENRILFTGNMPYFPNIDAVVFFARKVFPLISEKYSEFQFVIVGQQPPKVVRQLANEAIVVKGFVNDIRMEYLQSMISVAPMRFGAGTLNKIIESMALGTPVIASKQAVSGMDNQLKSFIFTADTPKEYVEQFEYIISNYDNVLVRQKEAIDWVKNNLAWEKIVSKFENELLLGFEQKKSTI